MIYPETQQDEYEYDSEQDYYSEEDYELMSGIEEIEQQRKLEISKLKPTVTYDIAETEAQLMEITCNTPKVVVHFSHRDFKRCRIMDVHLQQLATKHQDTRFLKIFVENANFLVEKLKIKVLPCVVCFIDGITVDKVTGFEGFGDDKDDFPTSALEWRLSQCKVIVEEKKETKIFGFESGYDEDEYA